MRLYRPLDPIEIRVLGSLLEKQQTTPDQYPLTLNGLHSACNQKTSRDPVMNLDESEIEMALTRLQELSLVWKVRGGRALRWDQRVAEAWGLDAESASVMTLLLLRGAQTVGELRSRSERMHRFVSSAQVEAVLERLSAGEGALAVRLPRRPGQKEERWRQNVGEFDEAVEDAPAPARFAVADSIADRVEKLETEVSELRQELATLKRELGM